MTNTRTFRFASAVAVALAASACADSPVAARTEPVLLSTTAFLTSSPSAQVGQALFQDPGLSVNKNQSCSTCHEPSQGFAAPLPGVVTRGSVVQGSVQGAFGARKPPTAAYATFAGNFSASGGSATGGNFWDGRATGAILGNPTADQALGPFLNPAEQALPDAACIALAIRSSAYATAFVEVWGDELMTIAFPANAATICSTPTAQPGKYVGLSVLDDAKATRVYYNAARSIREFEAAINTFSSAYDRKTLTALEQEGAKLFGGKGKCHQCHTVSGVPAVFTDYKYHNLGVPKNPANPVYNYSTSAVDPGLGGFTGRSAHTGKFKTPTVRNAGLGVGRTFMHNGVFVSLRQVVDFYNTRDVLPACTTAQLATLVPAQYGSFDPDGAGPLTAGRCWPRPEFAQNMDTKQMGALGLTEAQVNAIVAFMMALTDR
jgi:cytochrome c peroxidase